MRTFILSSLAIWFLSIILFVFSVAQGLPVPIQYVFGAHIFLGFGGTFAGLLFTYLNGNGF